MPTPGVAQAGAVVCERLWIADGPAGVSMVEGGTIAATQRLGDVRDIARADSETAVLADGRGQLLLVRCAEGRLRVVASLRVDGTPVGVAVEGTRWAAALLEGGAAIGELEGDRLRLVERRRDLGGTAAVALLGGIAGWLSRGGVLVLHGDEWERDPMVRAACDGQRRGGCALGTDGVAWWVADQAGDLRRVRPAGAPTRLDVDYAALVVADDRGALRAVTTGGAIMEVGGAGEEPPPRPGLAQRAVLVEGALFATHAAHTLTTWLRALDGRAWSAGGRPRDLAGASDGVRLVTTRGRFTARLGAAPIALGAPAPHTVGLCRFAPIVRLGAAAGTTASVCQRVGVLALGEGDERTLHALQGGAAAIEPVAGDWLVSVDGWGLHLVSADGADAFLPLPGEPRGIDVLHAEGRVRAAVACGAAGVALVEVRAAEPRLRLERLLNTWDTALDVSWASDGALLVADGSALIRLRP